MDAGLGVRTMSGLGWVRDEEVQGDDDLVARYGWWYRSSEPGTPRWTDRNQGVPLWVPGSVILTPNGGEWAALWRTTATPGRQGVQYFRTLLWEDRNLFTRDNRDGQLFMLIDAFTQDHQRRGALGSRLIPVHAMDPLNEFNTFLVQIPQESRAFLEAQGLGVPTTPMGWLTGVPWGMFARRWRREEDRGRFPPNFVPDLEEHDPDGFLSDIFEGHDS